MKTLSNTLFRTALLSMVSFSTFGATESADNSWLSPTTCVPASSAAARGATMAHTAMTTTSTDGVTFSTRGGAACATTSSALPTIVSTFPSALIPAKHVGWFVQHSCDWVDAWKENTETARPAVLAKASDLTEPLAGLAIELLQNSENPADKAAALTASRNYVENSTLPQSIYVAGSLAFHPAQTLEDNKLLRGCLLKAAENPEHPFREDALSFLSRFGVEEERTYAVQLGRALYGV